jgi:copper chaperone CopZ
MIKQKFNIIGMHCTACAMNIDGELEDTNGVKCASTNYAKQFTEVEYDESAVSDKDITKIISTLGYTANTD